MAADVNQTEDCYVSESYDEIVVLENVAMDDSVIEAVDNEVVVESASDGGSDDIYQAPSNADSTIYIDPNAGGSGDGSQEAPYNTIQAALDNIDTSNHNTLVLMDGEYKGDANTNLNIPGNIIIQSGSGNPTVDFENVANSWNFEGSNVVLNGIIFKNAENSNAIISTVGNVNNYTIRSCKFTNNVNSTLLNLSKVNEVSIIGCEFASNLATNDDKYSIIADNSNNISLNRNEVELNRYVTSGGFIHANNITNISLTKNDFSAIDSLSDGGVIYLNNASGKINVYDNIFVNPRCEQTGGHVYINANGADNITISENSFIGSSLKSKEGQGIYLSSTNSKGISISNNSFSRLASTNNGAAISISSNNDKVINIEDNEFTASRISNGRGGSI